MGWRKLCLVEATAPYLTTYYGPGRSSDIGGGGIFVHYTKKNAIH